MKKIMQEMKEKLSVAYIKGEREKDEDYYKRIAERDPEHIAEILRLKDRALSLYDTRLAYAQEVIDLVAEELDLNDKGLYLYALKVDDRHPILEKLKEYLSRGGNKVKLKKRVDELENENAVLRSIAGK